MEGKVCQWKDDKEFGFIQPSDGSERLFFHISSVKNQSNRPQVGDTVFYEAERDIQNRLKATSVIIDDSKDSAAFTSRYIKTSSPKKDVVDYLLVLTMLASLSFVSYQYYLSNELGDIWYYGLPAVVAFLLFNKQKQPKEKYFNCAGCHTVAEYDPRTLSAWNAGFTQLYCRTCYIKWLKNKSKSATQPEYNSAVSKSGSSSGCLGMLLVLVFVPIVTSVGLYHWLT